VKLMRLGDQGVDRPLNIALGWRIPSWILDFGPVALIAAAGFGTIGVRGERSVGRASVLILAVVVVTIALLLRHRRPILTLAVTLAVALVIDYGAIATLPVLLAVFTVAEYCDRDQVIGAGVAAAIVLVAAPLLHGASTAPRALSVLIPVGLAVALGLYLRTRADHIIGLQDRAARLEREQELRSSQAAAEERVRIARELHDVVAHNVSLMVVQAQALAATGAGDENEHAALRRLADLGREALSEMHRMLGVLRLQNGVEAERDPQPGVRDLEALVARTRETGVLVDLQVRGEPRDVPPGVDLSAYRIVQEALTNVVRHAAASHATVTLAYLAEGLDVTVVDDGVGSNGDRDGSARPGHGLVGMRERVSLFGGELEAGERSDTHGYRVHAVLPVR
jgi:signal transduction histidine kinase